MNDLLGIFSTSGELTRISAEVDPDQELPAIVDRMAQQHGPAILFERVKGQSQPVVANLWGSIRRLNLALDLKEPEQFNERCAQLTTPASHKGWLGGLRKKASAISPLESFTPKTVKTGPVQQVVKLGRDVDLTHVPALRSWPQEDCRSINAGQIFSVDPESALATIGHGPLMVTGRAQLGIPWHPYHALFRQAEIARQRGEKLPVAIVLGGSPVLRILSQLPFFNETNLLAFAGAWQESALNVVRCRTQPLDVPAEAEVVLEGYLDPSADSVPLPTFVSPGGQYVRNFPGWTIHVTARTQRTKAVWPVMVYSPRFCEQSFLSCLAKPVLLPDLQSLAPEVVDLEVHHYGTAGQTVFVSLQKPIPAAARRVANIIWGHPALMLTKTIVLVDEAVQLSSPAEVWQQVTAHVDAERDIFVQQGPTDPFDVSSGNTFAGLDLTGGGKFGIDATTKPERNSIAAGGELSGLPRASSETLAQLARRWEEYGVEKASQPAKKTKV